MAKTRMVGRVRYLVDEEGKPTSKRAVRVVKILKDDSSSGAEGLSRNYIEQEDVDQFEPFYSEQRLLAPPYSFARLQQLYEESDIVQECVDAMMQNVDGFGYQMQFLGDDVTQRKTTQAVKEYERASNFFDHVNEYQSLMTIRKLFRKDREVLGNGAFEVVRNRLGAIACMYHLPFQTLRISTTSKRPTTIEVPIKRDGKVISIKVQKYFRKFCQISTATGGKLRWFKTFGDPRFLDATTGEFKATARECKVLATEIIHQKLSIGTSVYGIPRWMGVIADVIGRRSSQFVNYDLFESQGIPPMAILVSGGVLTDDSLEDLNALIASLRGAQQWNKILVLETQLESTGLEDKGTTKIELKNLAEYRKDDLMFANYQASTEKTIRHRWRLPPLYVGSAETFTHATSKAAKEVAEEQIFIPDRTEFDEFVNSQILIPELGIEMWAYKTNGPKMVGPEEISSGVKTFADAGAFSTNNAIQMANEAFGLQMSKLADAWADYPFPIVMKLVEKGVLKGIEAISTPIETLQNALPAPKGPLMLPEKIEKSDFFSDEEKVLYKRLMTIQYAVENLRKCQ